MQVEGRSQPGDPGHHCFLQSESEAGGIAGRVSVLAQPETPTCRRGCPRPPGAHCPILPVRWTFLAASTKRVNQAGGLPVPSLPPCSFSSSSVCFPSPVSETFDPSPALSMSLSSSPSLPYPCLGTWGCCGGEKLPQNLWCGVSRGFCPLITSWGHSTHPSSRPC